METAAGVSCAAMARTRGGHDRAGSPTTASPPRAHGARSPRRRRGGQARPAQHKLPWLTGQAPEQGSEGQRGRAARAATRVSRGRSRDSGPRCPQGPRAAHRARRPSASRRQAARPPQTQQSRGHGCSRGAPEGPGAPQGPGAGTRDGALPEPARSKHVTAGLSPAGARPSLSRRALVTSPQGCPRCLPGTIGPRGAGRGKQEEDGAKGWGGASQEEAGR